MPKAWLECRICHVQLDIGPQFTGCLKCLARGTKAALEVRYDYTRPGLFDSQDSGPGIWCWRKLLPPAADENIVSLHEGNTPLVRLRSYPLYLKNETANPTWSYKDRANSVSMSMARQFGLRNVAVISTGNHGGSAAAYCAAACLPCVVFCHEDAPEQQVALMHHYGAQVFRGGRQDEMLRRVVARGGWFADSILCPRGGCANPYGVEGFKTIAFEIFHQLGNKVPDRVFVPVGSGDGLYGIWKGFCELRRAGATDRTPRMYACQAAGADPYVRAFRAAARGLTPLDSAHTVALSIAEKVGGDAALDAVYESGGAALSVTDSEILQAARCLAREGFAVEPASAAAFACAQALDSRGAGGETWVAIGTGAAVKWPESLLHGFLMPAKLPPGFDRIQELPL